MAKSKTIDLLVITPERQVLETTTDSVVIPAHDGELGVLRDRAPLMCELGIGQLRYRENGDVRRMFIDGGFAQVNQNSVTVLTNAAVSAEQITSEMLADAERPAEGSDATGPQAAEARQRAQRRAGVLRGLRRES
jgi:F-type H+-transporting ATPase subunit epsilon